MATTNKYEGYEIYVKTIKANKFKQLIEALKDILQDVNLDFKQDGISIKSVDSTESVFICSCHNKLNY